MTWLRRSVAALFVVSLLVGATAALLAPHDAEVPAAFVHPGVLVGRAQLEAVRAHLAASEEPWQTAFARLRASPLADPAWQPHPRPVVECGFESRPERGCREETSDALAAYTHALMWSLTRDTRHARAAMGILDAWSGVLRRHTHANAPLQAGLAAASFVRAAELIRHTGAGWPGPEVARFASLLRTVYLPILRLGSPGSNGHWDLVMLDATAGIAVFLDDRRLFDATVTRWRARLAGYVYLAGDGPLPRPAPGRRGTRDAIVAYWHGQQRFVDGLAQETCRDFAHTGWGLGAAAHVAETAWIQGIDLYAEARPRLVAALEFHAAYELGAAVPGWLCGGSLRLGLVPSPDVAYHHYAGRIGLVLPHTRRLLEARRPAGAGAFYGWESLTHG